MILTDLEIVHAIEPGLKVPYETALKFANAIPDYSLLQYRELTFLICQYLASRSDLTFESSSLHTIINELHESQLIHTAQREMLHRLRILGNQGAHKSAITPGRQESEKTPRQQVDQRLLTMREDAAQAREIFLELAGDLYRLDHPHDNPSIAQTLIGEQDHKEILFTAIKEDRNWQAQYEAGLTYERVAEEYANKTWLLKTVPECVHWASLLTKAMASFEAAWKQSAIDTQLEPEVAFIDYDNPDNRMAQLCKLEPLYQYCRLCFQLFDVDKPELDTEWSRPERRSWKLLLQAANRDHPSANTLVGKTFLYGLPGKNPEFTQAARYLKKAHKLGAEDIYLPLYWYYSDKRSAEFDTATAMDFLQKGEENGCVDCQHELAMQYFHGEYVAKDLSRAREKLEQAAAKGHGNAMFSLDMHFGDLLERMRQIEGEYEDVFEDYGIADEPYVRPPKIGRNEPCPCGSGRKYKKCCSSANDDPQNDFPLLQKGYSPNGYS